MATVNKVYKLTKTRYAELEEELYHAKTVREREVAEQIKEARSFGDLSENSEYDEAKNEQGKLHSRIAELEDIISHAVIIEEQTVDESKVDIGSTVMVLNLQNNTKMEYQLVGSQEADPRKGRISDESPLGHALMGAHPDEEISFEAPVGEMKFRVLAVRL